MKWNGLMMKPKEKRPKYKSAEYIEIFDFPHTLVGESNRTKQPQPCPNNSIMDLTSFIDKIKSSPETVEFNDVIATIDEHYEFTPTPFKNGELYNEAGRNSGSCKLFSFAKLHQLTKQQTLNCFGNYYKDVLNTAEGNDHQNIRNFIKTGWEGISFEGNALKQK